MGNPFQSSSPCRMSHSESPMLGDGIFAEDCRSPLAIKRAMRLVTATLRGSPTPAIDSRYFTGPIDLTEAKTNISARREAC